MPDLLRPIKRGPVNLDGDVLVELGRVLEVEFGGDVLIRPTHPKRPKLYWSAAKKCLVFFTGVKMDGGRGTRGALDELLDTKAGRAAAKVFARWSQREPAGGRTVDVGVADKWWKFSVAPLRIDYWSDKLGDKASYTHDLGPSVRAWLQVSQNFGSSTRSKEVWIFRGGRLTVTERGIVG